MDGSAPSRAESTLAWTASILVLAGIGLVANSDPLGPFYSLVGPASRCGIPECPPIWVWAPAFYGGVATAALGWAPTIYLLVTSRPLRFLSAAVDATLVFFGLWLIPGSVYGPILGAVIVFSATPTLIAGPGLVLGLLMSFFGWVGTTLLLSKVISREPIRLSGNSSVR